MEYWRQMPSGRVTYTELNVWSAHTGLTLMPWESEALVNLDNIMSCHGKP